MNLEMKPEEVSEVSEVEMMETPPRTMACHPEVPPELPLVYLVCQEPRRYPMMLETPVEPRLETPPGAMAKLMVVVGPRLETLISKLLVVAPMMSKVLLVVGPVVVGPMVVEPVMETPMSKFLFVVGPLVVGIPCSMLFVLLYNQLLLPSPELLPLPPVLPFALTHSLQLLPPPLELPFALPPPLELMPALLDALVLLHSLLPIRHLF